MCVLGGGGARGGFYDKIANYLCLNLCYYSSYLKFCVLFILMMIERQLVRCLHRFWIWLPRCSIPGLVTAPTFLLEDHCSLLSHADTHHRRGEANMSICACKGALILHNCAPLAPYLLHCWLLDTTTSSSSVLQIALITPPAGEGPPD